MNACEACGQPIPETGGHAILCGPGGGRLVLPAPRFCTTRKCREARDAAAIQRAVESGLIDP